MRIAARSAGLTLGLALLGLLFLAGGPAPPRAAAAGITPCNAAPTGPIVTLDGEATLGRTAAARKMLRRAGVRTSLIHPANALTGWPTFPVRKVRFGSTSRVWLKGALRFKRKRRSIVARKLTVVVPANRRKRARVTAKLGGRTVVLYRLRGDRRAINRKRGELDLQHAAARLGGSAAARINRRLGLARAPQRKRIRSQVRLDRFDLSAIYLVTERDNPVAETPVEPPVAEMPSGAVPAGAAPTGQVSVKWELRDTWIDYVNTGSAPKPEGGTTADDPRPPKNLVYSFNFPFTSGWTVPGGGDPGGISTLIRGAGSLAFRYCEHTVNFRVADPEIELGDDQHSRMIFRVDGTDGTAFPDKRAVMVRLSPSRAAAHSETGNPDGSVTVTWTRIPGYIPAEGTGIFADFYPAYDPSFGDPGSGYTPATRPDRFGFLSVTFTIPAPAP